MADQINFSIVKNDLMHGTFEKYMGFRNKVCVLHLKAASLHTHEKKELLTCVFNQKKILVFRRQFILTAASCPAWKGNNI